MTDHYVKGTSGVVRVPPSSGNTFDGAFFSAFPSLSGSSASGNLALTDNSVHDPLGIYYDAAHHDRILLPKIGYYRLVSTIHVNFAAAQVFLDTTTSGPGFFQIEGFGQTYKVRTDSLAQEDAMVTIDEILHTLAVNLFIAVHGQITADDFAIVTARVSSVQYLGT